MHLMLVRHAEREQLPSVADNAQVLTAKGQKAAHALGQYLAGLKLPSDLIIFSSDYARALQTAQLIVSAGPNKWQLQTKTCLRPEAEGSMPEILALIKAHASYDYLMLIGHQPELEQVGAYFTGQLLPLKKAEAVCLLVSEEIKGASKIAWRYHAK